MTCMQTVFLCAVLLVTPSLAHAQTATTPAEPLTQQPPAQPPATAPDPPAEQNDPDMPVDILQPDFTLVALPTTLRVPKGKMGFRITHRFTRALGRGDFGDLLADFFGFDNGAIIGLELRYGLRPGTQIGIHRTSDRTIQLFGQQSLLKERDGRPIGLDALLTLEGDDNLSEHHQVAIGALISRSLGRAGTFYVEPIWMANTRPDVTILDTTTGGSDDDSTLMLGVGARLRLRPKLYIVAEATPRLAGYDPGTTQVSFGFEGRSGGHSFQVNVSNGFGTTFGQLARGGIGRDDWFIGFNISRKFF